MVQQIMNDRCKMHESLLLIKGGFFKLCSQEKVDNSLNGKPLMQYNNGISCGYGKKNFDQMGQREKQDSWQQHVRCPFPYFCWGHIKAGYASSEDIQPTEKQARRSNSDQPGAWHFTYNDAEAGLDRTVKDAEI